MTCTTAQDMTMNTMNIANYNKSFEYEQISKKLTKTVPRL